MSISKQSKELADDLCGLVEAYLQIPRPDAADRLRLAQSVATVTRVLVLKIKQFEECRQREGQQ